MIARKLHPLALPMCLVLCALLVGPTSALAEDGGSPSAVVERLHDSLIDAMRHSDELGYQGRYDRIAPVVASSFDLQFMAEKSVGRHWKSLDEAGRARWVDTFERLTTANYAGRFKGYTGQNFETLGEEPAAHQTMVVRTKLVLPDEDDVQLNYRLRQTDAGWRVVDVYLNGTVSELALRRSEYATVLKRDGFETLVANLDQKVEDLAAGRIQ